MFRLHSLLTLSLFASGCFGTSTLSATDDDGTNSGGSGVYVPGCGADCDAPVSTTRFARLTHTQWENSVQDVLALSARSNLSTAFTSDTRSGTFDTHLAGLAVGSTLWSDYQRAAETLATNATASDAAMAALLPSGIPASGSERVQAFVEHLGRRAFRRPLTKEETAAFVALHGRGLAGTALTDSFRAGARLVISAMLQSPHFLYRVETSGSDTGKQTPLTPYEVASRLSFSLWNTTPDEALLAAAGSGALSTEDGVKAQAQRLLSDPRAREVLSRFHTQLFETDLFRETVRNPADYPGITARFAESIQLEADRFVDDVVFTRGEGIREILTRTNSFANAELAGLYGLSGSFDTELRPVELDASTRSGLLTRIGFMSYYGHGNDSDPIRRGVFVNLRLLCASLPPPPNNVSPLPPAQGGTTREIVTAHTGAGTCGASCHGVFINPVGFAFENYDGMGRWRLEEAGKTVNAADSYKLTNGQTVSFTNAKEFSQQLAEAQQTHACYAQHWIEYLLGRDVAAADANLMTRLGADSLDGLGTVSLVSEIVGSRAFRVRAAEAL